MWWNMGKRKVGGRYWESDHPVKRAQYASFSFPSQQLKIPPPFSSWVSEKGTRHKALGAARRTSPSASPTNSLQSWITWLALIFRRSCQQLQHGSLEKHEHRRQDPVHPSDPHAVGPVARRKPE